MINLVSYRVSRGFLFPKPVPWLGLFCLFLQQTSSSPFSQGSKFITALDVNLPYFLETWKNSIPRSLFCFHKSKVKSRFQPYRCVNYWGGGRKHRRKKKHLKCAFVALDLVKKLQSLHGGHHVQLK